jgi:hypothetical protein
MPSLKIIPTVSRHIGIFFTGQNDRSRCDTVCSRISTSSLRALAPLIYANVTIEPRFESRYAELSGHGELAIEITQDDYHSANAKQGAIDWMTKKRGIATHRYEISNASRAGLDPKNLDANHQLYLARVALRWIRRTILIEKDSIGAVQSGAQ